MASIGKDSFNGLVVKDKSSIQKVRGSILNPGKEKEAKTVETIRKAFSKIGIK